MVKPHDEYITINGKVWKPQCSVATSRDIEDHLKDGMPGDWWVKGYGTQLMCSYVLLRRTTPVEWTVLITRSDGKIWISQMYEMASKVEL